jgi:hypothetical protein
MSAFYNIHLLQGSDFKRVLTLKNGDTPVDLTGCEFRGEARATYESASTVFSFGFSIVDAAAGKVEMTVASTVTAALAATCEPVDVPKKLQKTALENLPAGYLVYDVEVVYADDSVQRLLWGGVMVSREVTRG